jgi:hypothetical protein
MITEWKNRPEDDLGRRLHVMTSYEGSLIMRGGATYAPTVIMSPGTSPSCHAPFDDTTRGSYRYDIIKIGYVNITIDGINGDNAKCQRDISIACRDLSFALDMTKNSFSIAHATYVIKGSINMATPLSITRPALFVAQDAGRFSSILIRSLVSCVDYSCVM